MRATNVVRSVGAVVAAALVLLGPSVGQAQEFGADAGGGISLPSGDLAEAWSAGPSFGLGFKAGVSDRVAVRVDGNMALNEGHTFGPNRVPDLTQYRYTGGIEIRFTNTRAPSLFTTVGIGGGATTMVTDDYRLPGGQVTDFNHIYPTGYGALRLGYRVSERVAFSLRLRTWLTLMDEEDSRDFAVFTDGEVEAFEEEWSFPLQLRTEVAF